MADDASSDCLSWAKIFCTALGSNLSRVNSRTTRDATEAVLHAAIYASRVKNTPFPSNLLTLDIHADGKAPWIEKEYPDDTIVSGKGGRWDLQVSVEGKEITRLESELGSNHRANVDFRMVNEPCLNDAKKAFVFEERSENHAQKRFDDFVSKTGDEPLVITMIQRKNKDPYAKARLRTAVAQNGQVVEEP